ncbi:MAG: division/cell wall cluster transcriptional repressor MraZ [Chitinophagaceae bacterium]
MGYLGEFQSTIDQKGRFLLPVGIKKQLPEEGKTMRFVINRGFEKCLTIYPENVWEPLFENLKILNDFDPKVRTFRRIFLNGATWIEIDSAGRLLLPKHLSEYAGLNKDIIISSAIDKFEIWNKRYYEEFNQKLSPSEFSELAAMVMDVLPKND